MSLCANKGISTILFYGLFITFVTVGAFLVYPISLMIKEGVNINLQEIKNVFEFGIVGIKGEYILVKSRTYAFTALGLSQLFHMFGMSNVNKSFVNVLKNKNILMWIAFILGITLQVAVIEIKVLSNFFQTTRLNIYEWGWILLLSSLPLLAHEIIVKFSKKKS